MDQRVSAGRREEAQDTVSDRHMHITGFLYDDAQTIERFVRAADATGFFRDVAPVKIGESVRAVAFHSKDLDGASDPYSMPEIAEKLSGILEHDIVIASAWELPGYHDERRQNAFLVRGHRTGTEGE
jgi:hypothetical protein